MKTDEFSENSENTPKKMDKHKELVASSSLG